ncbi:hypothetical protein ACFYZ8_32635 [Streptomyces sp. NPDC001668]|uniref:hypothetical protein n=1 Tax=unclassified Streptomyces TaxID=2593676 RepID=UPI0036C7DFD0
MPARPRSGTGADALRGPACVFGGVPGAYGGFVPCGGRGVDLVDGPFQETARTVVGVPGECGGSTPRRSRWPGPAASPLDESARVPGGTPGADGRPAPCGGR